VLAHTRHSSGGWALSRCIARVHMLSCTVYMDKHVDRAAVRAPCAHTESAAVGERQLNLSEFSARPQHPHVLDAFPTGCVDHVQATSAARSQRIHQCEESRKGVMV
jgi:hypothetical protein